MVNHDLPPKKCIPCDVKNEVWFATISSLENDTLLYVALAGLIADKLSSSVKHCK